MAEETVVPREDMLPLKDFKAISQMVERANSEGLLVEVIWSLCHSLKPGMGDKTIEKECFYALSEWDI